MNYDPDQIQNSLNTRFWRDIFREVRLCDDVALTAGEAGRSSRHLLLRTPGFFSVSAGRADRRVHQHAHFTEMLADRQAWQ